jgi:DHA1 family purine base/nucleoside efflux pump-like MFS transporter
MFPIVRPMGPAQGAAPTILTPHRICPDGMQLPKFLRPISAFVTRDRRVLFLMGIVGFVAGYGSSQMSHTLPFARETLGLTEGQMSLAFALVRAASLLGVAFALVADRKGRRRPLMVAYVLLTGGSLLTAFFANTVMYVASQSLVRIAVVAIAGIGLVLIAEELTPGLRAYGIGLYGLAGSLGVGTGLLLLPIAERTTGAWRLLFAFTGLGLLAFPTLNRYLPESRAFRAGPTIRFLKALGMGLGRHFWPLAGIAFFVAAFSAPAFDFVLERLIDDLGWDTGAARFVLIVFSGLGALGLLAGGRFADLFGRRPTTIAALIIGLAGGLGFYLLDSGWTLAISIFLATLGATMLTPAFGSARTELFPTRVRATAGGWVTNIAILGSISGFLFGAALIDRIGLSQTIALLGIGIVVSVFLELLLPETKGLDLVRIRRTSTSGDPPDTAATPPPTATPPE